MTFNRYRDRDSCDRDSCELTFPLTIHLAIIFERFNISTMLYEQVFVALPLFIKFPQAKCWLILLTTLPTMKEKEGLKKDFFRDMLPYR